MKTVQFHNLRWNISVPEHNRPPLVLGTIRSRSIRRVCNHPPPPPCCSANTMRQARFSHPSHGTLLIPAHRVSMTLTTNSLKTKNQNQKSKPNSSQICNQMHCSCLLSRQQSRISMVQLPPVKNENRSRSPFAHAGSTQIIHQLETTYSMTYLVPGIILDTRLHTRNSVTFG